MLDSLTAGHGATIGGAWGSSCALVAASLAAAAPGPLVVVLAHGDDIEAFSQDLALFSRPAGRRLSAQRAGPARAGARRREFRPAAASCSSGLLEDRPPRIVVTSIQAIQQPVPRPGRGPRANPAAGARGRGRRAGPAHAGWSSTAFTPPAPSSCPANCRIAAAFSICSLADWNEPVRIEFFGDEIESIRRFEVSSQRSLDTLESIEVTALAPSADDREHFAGYLPAEQLVRPGRAGRHRRRRAAFSGAAGKSRTTPTASARRWPKSIAFPRSRSAAFRSARWKRPAI